MTAKYGYIGYGPDTSPVIVAKQVFSPTGIQTNFTFAAGYQIGYLDVYLNGARQIEGQDFSATDTSTIGLTTSAQSGDVLELVAYKAYNLAAPTSVGSFAVGGNLTVSGNAAIVGNESVSTLIATTAIGIGSTYTTATTLPYPITITASGSTPTPSLSYCIADISSNQNGYSQFNLRNTNTGSNASGDLVITTDNGTDTTNFIDLGINNTGFNDAGWTVNGALDGYLYSSNTNLSVGVAFTNRYLSFFAGGTLAANEKIRVTSTGVGIGTTNTSNILSVGTGITFTASGINVTGIVTATSFRGDGSLLSGISSVSFATTSFGLSGTPNLNVGITTVTQLGINTTTIPTKLYVQGNAASNIVGLGSTSGTVTLDFTQGNSFSLTLTANTTLANPTGVTTGQSGVIFIQEDGTGGYTVGWGTSWDFASSTAPTLTTTASALNALPYFARSTTSIVVGSVIAGIGTL
jgi:hypothetical protein